MAAPVMGGAIASCVGSAKKQSGFLGWRIHAALCALIGVVRCGRKVEADVLELHA